MFTLVPTAYTTSLMSLRNSFLCSGSPLEVLDYNSTSVTLFCDHFFEAERYDITIEVLSSFQTGYEEFQRIKFVAVTLPTTVSIYRLIVSLINLKLSTTGSSYFV